MNYRLAQRAQTDAWYDRHGVNAYKSTLFQTQIASAINADHSAALDMNANDDSGRAAFLGTDANRARSIAAIHAFAAYLAAHPEQPLPESLTASVHTDGTPAQRTKSVTDFAARHGLEICETKNIVYADLYLSRQETDGIDIVLITIGRVN